MGCAAHLAGKSRAKRKEGQMMSMTISTQSSIENNTGTSARMSTTGGAISGRKDIKAASKAEKRPIKRATNKTLKQHLKYIVPEIRLALVRETSVKPQRIYSADCLDLFVEPLRHYSEEHFIAFHLDVKFQVIGYHEVSKGTLSASLVHPREVFKAAILSNSYAIICAHNHPSGIETASKEDIEITKKLIEAGELLNVQVLDHVIVTATGLTSLRENNAHLWF
jgi:DNA repair protein RadC